MKKYYMRLRIITAWCGILVEAAISDEQWLAVLKKSTVRYGQRTLGQFEDDELYNLIEQVRQLVPQHQRKFAPYYIYQVARGNLVLSRLAEDGYRLNKTIDAFIKASRKAAWTGSKNLYDYNNWRELEQMLADHGLGDFGEQEDVQHSKILYTETFVDRNALVVAELLGEPIDEPPFVRYWLRRILTSQGAYKYGRGTQWCTAVDPAEFTGTGHPFECYNALYILEKQTNDTPRRPIMQISGNQIMNKHDVPIGGFNSQLCGFIGRAVRAAGEEMDEHTADALLGICHLR